MTSTLPTAEATATFRELGVSAAAAGALEKRGYTTPLPVQAIVLPDILEGRDILAKSPPAPARRSPSWSPSWTASTRTRLAAGGAHPRADA